MSRKQQCLSDAGNRSCADI